MPAEGKGSPWSGFTKTASTVILMTTGTACTSSFGRVLTVSAFSTDPEFIGANTIAADYIRLCANGGTGCTAGSGSDQGGIGSGTAGAEPCTTKLLNLPPTHA